MRRRSTPWTISTSYTLRCRRIKLAESIGRLFATRRESTNDTYETYGQFTAQMQVTDGSVPSLARALAAAAGSRLGLAAGDEATLRGRFVATVAAMDRADLAYLRTIAETLPPASVRDILAAMASFRDEVRRIRRQTYDRFAALYERYGRTYGPFDPIDPYLPPATGLTHADETRIAAVADGARAEIDELRAAANRTSGARLEASHVETLLEAKRRRRAAFEAELKVAFLTGIPTRLGLEPTSFAKTVSDLNELADGWY
jgi:hypothetical protein